MTKRKIKMVDIVKPTRSEHLADSTRKAHFLTKDKHSKEPKSERQENKLFKEFGKKIECFEREEVKVFGEEDTQRKKKFLFLKGHKLKTLFWLILILILISGVVYGAITFLPRAEIKISAEKFNWEYIDSITASKNVSSISLVNKKIPAEVFSQLKNNNLLFPASGKLQIEKKATGKIIIYNAYSSKSQRLIIETRFLAPDGKIFYLTKGITVPGAKIIEGKVVSSSIIAEVVADKSGEEYNIKPVEYFSIPGFKGSAKYQGFYAESKESMTGGFIGEAIVPTDEDIKKAKEKNRQILQQAFISFIDLQIPNGFKIIEEAKQFNIIKETVNKETDSVGNFSVFSEAKIVIVVFQEKDAKNLIVAFAKEELGQEFEPKEYQLTYGISRTDFDSGRMSFPVDFQGVFWQPINIDEFRESVKSKKEAELRGMVFSLPGVEKVAVSFWPFWVKQVPDDIKRIKVVIE